MWVNMALDASILQLVNEAGKIGVTAQQVAYKLGKKRETVSHYLWVLKKAGKITNINRNLWVTNKNMPRLVKDGSKRTD